MPDKRCSFGNHKWLVLDPIPRPDKKYDILKVCLTCGKQKRKTARLKSS